MAVQQATLPQRQQDVRESGAAHLAVSQDALHIVVTPGAQIVLPEAFADATTFTARIGDGNLAIKVGNIVVVLEGYVAANDAAPVTIMGKSGAVVDIAAVLAATDPALDIETAAGPAISAPVPASGHLLSPHEAGPGLGGLAAVGPLDETALHYRLIDNVIRQERDDASNDNGSTDNNGAPTVGSSVATVDEAALATGSDPDSAEETVIGTLIVTADRGVVSISIDGIIVDLAKASATETIVGSHGILTITAWDETTGTLSYSYTLTTALAHDSVQGTNSDAGDSFVVTVTDGDAQSASGTIAITVIDDVPTAVADSGTTCTCGDASGNVLANDTAGADGIARIATVTDGVHTYTLDAAGVLTTNDDASNYSYDAATGLLTITTTSGGGTLTFDLSGDDVGDYSYSAGTSSTAETFSYTIVDGDGDTASAGLAITVSHAETLAVADHIYTLTEDFSVANSWLTANDQPNGHLSVSGTSDAESLTLTDLGWGTAVALDDGVTHGSFSYTISSSSSGGSGEAVVPVDLVESTSHAIDQSASTEDVILLGDSHDNVLTGGSGDDVIVGGAGTDTLIGNAGNDTFVYDAMDSFDGGSGIDRVTFGSGISSGFDESLLDRLHGIEVLDTRNGSADVLGTTAAPLTIAAVLDMTDSGELWITSESSDTITLASGFNRISDVTNATESDGIPNGTYATYTATDGAHSVVVHIDSALVATA
jgi:hypothetical protein